MIQTYFAEAPLQGHPDKAADIVADCILDACLESDSHASVACEVLIAKNMVSIAGEITVAGEVSFESVARRVLTEIGYSSPESGLDAANCEVFLSLSPQSESIAAAVSPSLGGLGAGDQCIVIGYAVANSFGMIPPEAAFAKRLASAIDKARLGGRLAYLYPDGKVLVGVSGDEVPKIQIMSISVHHHADVSPSSIFADLHNFVREEVNFGVALPDDLILSINPPNGRFTVGGPVADTGVTGRKIIASTYGPRIPHGGGAFSGKDPTKIDRTGAYGARYIAKQLVNSGFASEVRVTLAYEMGAFRPLGVVLLNGIREVSWIEAKRHCTQLIDPIPQVFLDTLNLRRPIYRQATLAYDFGLDGTLPWETTAPLMEIHK